MKRIAIVIGNISFHAGTERAVTNLANMLVKNGDYYVLIISMYSLFHEKPYYELDSRIRVEHLGLKFASKVKKFFCYLKFIKVIPQILKKHQIEYVLGTTHAINSMLVFVRFKCKKIGCEHMNYDACPRISSFIRRICYKNLDSLVVLTSSDSRHYNFIDQRKLFIIPNSLSFTCDKPADLAHKRMIAVGRLTEQKGFDILIKAAIKIRNELPDWKIDIFGNGEDKQKLKEMISQYALSDYVFINEPVRNIKEKLLNSSLYIMSSRWEGLPMILLEAKACGLPIVSFNCPEGPADVINDNEDGFLIEPENINDLVKKVIEICKNNDLLKRFGQLSFENSSQYSELNVYQKWHKFFSEI